MLSPTHHQTIHPQSRPYPPNQYCTHWGSIGNAVSRVKKTCLFVPEMVLNKAILVRISVSYRAKSFISMHFQHE